MLEDPEALRTILGALDSLIALGIAIWIITVGIKRFDTMQERHQKFTEMVLAQQQNNNDELMQLVSTLCIQPLNPTPPKLKEAPA